jgi:hypothetical protein
MRHWCRAMGPMGLRVQIMHPETAVEKPLDVDCSSGGTALSGCV